MLAALALVTSGTGAVPVQATAVASDVSASQDSEPPVAQPSAAARSAAQQIPDEWITNAGPIGGNVYADWRDGHVLAGRFVAGAELHDDPAWDLDDSGPAVLWLHDGMGDPALEIVVLGRDRAIKAHLATSVGRDAFVRYDADVSDILVFVSEEPQTYSWASIVPLRRMATLGPGQPWQSPLDYERWLFVGYPGGFSAPPKQVAARIEAPAGARMELSVAPDSAGGCLNQSGGRSCIEYWIVDAHGVPVGPSGRINAREPARFVARDDQYLVLTLGVPSTLQRISLEAAPATPSVPQDVQVQARARGASVSWAAPRDQGASPVTGYTATARPGGASCTTTALSCTISGMRGKAEHSVTVVARNAAGASPATPATSVTTLPGPADAPTAVKAWVTGPIPDPVGAVSVSWRPPAYNGGSPIVSYEVSVGPVQTNVGAEARYTQLAVPFGKRHQVSVRAITYAPMGSEIAGSKAFTFVTTPPAPKYATAKVRAVSRNGKLRVDVGPDSVAGQWQLRIQRLQVATGKWQTVKVSRTKGRKHVRTVNLKAGWYRVDVLPAHGYQGVRADATPPGWPTDVGTDVVRLDR